MNSGGAPLGVTIVTSINEASFGGSVVTGGSDPVSLVEVTACVGTVPTTIRVVRSTTGGNCRAAVGVVTISGTEARSVATTLRALNGAPMGTFCVISDCNTLCPRRSEQLTSLCYSVTSGRNGSINVRTRGGRRLTFTGAVRTVARNIDCLSTAISNVNENTNGYTLRLLLNFLGGPGCRITPVLGVVRRCARGFGTRNIG